MISYPTRLIEHIHSIHSYSVAENRDCSKVHRPCEWMMENVQNAISDHCYIGERWKQREESMYSLALFYFCPQEYVESPLRYLEGENKYVAFLNDIVLKAKVAIFFLISLFKTHFLPPAIVIPEPKLPLFSKLTHFVRENQYVFNDSTINQCF